MIVYRTDEKLPVKFDKHTVYITPLNSDEYARVHSHVKYRDGKIEQDRAAMVSTALRSSIKGFSSQSDVTFSDGSKFELEFDEDGLLSQRSLDVLYQVLGAGSMSVVGFNVATGMINDLPVVKSQGSTKAPAIKKKQAS